MESPETSRRSWLTVGLSGAAAAAFSTVRAAAQPAEPPPDKTLKIGVISASIRGQPHKANGHTWHFAQYLHPRINYEAIAKYSFPGSEEFFRKLRSPAWDLGQLPFPRTEVTAVYDADPQSAAEYAEAFPGVQVAASLEEIVQGVDAVWLGDASGDGSDHLELVTPALERGLPTFCDKPIGGTVERTRAILELAKQHRAPLMSSSLFRHQWGTETALRMRDSGEFGELQYVVASQAGGYSPEGWFVYGQHPTWMAVTLCGAGVESVSMYARDNTAHALLTYADRMPAEVWYGRPDAGDTYCHTSVHFTKRAFAYTPAIEGDYWFGHHYQMFRMAQVFRQMALTGVEPVPHQEILEVTAILHAGAKSLQEQGRRVALAEVL